MAQPGSRIPAWKRLGLTLRKSSQSGDQQELRSPQVAEQHHREVAGGPNNTNIHPVAAPSEEPASRLGKRKHQSDPADHGESPKKSKKSHQQNETGGERGVSAPKAADGDVDSVSDQQESAHSPRRPKGDPNYRKKQGKKEKKREDRRALSPAQPDLEIDDATLVPSTENGFPASPTVTTFTSNTARATSSSTPRSDRRKSVTFTPDTKTADGSSASNLFKKWVQEQKDSSAEFTQTEVANFVPPPKVHPANSIGTSKETTKVKRSQNQPSKKTGESTNGTTPTKGKKKDPSIYLSYLTQYHNDRSSWKFNKAKQNDVLDNALNVFRIPQEFSEALIEYVKGLKGAGAIERLRKRCISTMEEVDKDGQQQTLTMDDPNVRKAAQEEALQERLLKERKRRRLQGDIENMLDHPYTEGYIRRLKRGRAEALLTALNIAAPSPRTDSPRTLPAARDSRKRKRRVEASSDESSSSSSSSDESSSSEETDSESSLDSSTSDDSNSVDECSEQSSDEGSGKGTNQSMSAAGDDSEDRSESSNDSDSE